MSKYLDFYILFLQQGLPKFFRKLWQKTRCIRKQLIQVKFKLNVTFVKCCQEVFIFGLVMFFYYFQKWSVHDTPYYNGILSACYFAFMFSSAFTKFTVFLIWDNISIAKKLLKVHRYNFICFRSMASPFLEYSSARVVTYPYFLKEVFAPSDALQKSCSRNFSII